MSPGSRRGRVLSPRQAGFSYLGLLLWLAIAGIGLAAMGQMWSTDARRMREAELEFRGNEYAAGLGAWAAAHNGKPPKALEDLLADDSQGNTRRYLRRLYRDPVTGKQEWGTERDAEGRITAVFSDSPMKPLRDLGKVKTYREWRFEAKAPAWAASGVGAASAPTPDAASAPGVAAPPSPFGSAPFGASS